MNKLTLIGNLTGEPEVRSTPNGTTVCAFTIAVERRHADKNGDGAVSREELRVKRPHARGR